MEEIDRQKLEDELRRIDPATWKFGKHRGKYLRELPGRYLVWCINHMTGLSVELRVRLIDELARRIGK
jgi:hypothetical protein